RLVWQCCLVGLALSSHLSPAAAEDVQRREEGNLVFESMPEIPQTLLDRLLQYQNTRSASLQGWTSAGHAIITTRFAETNQVHRVDRPMGARHQLTFFDEPIRDARVRPDAPGFLFTKDIGGSENHQVYYF